MATSKPHHNSDSTTDFLGNLDSSFIYEWDDPTEFSPDPKPQISSQFRFTTGKLAQKRCRGFRDEVLLSRVSRLINVFDLGLVTAMCHEDIYVLLSSCPCPEGALLGGQMPYVGIAVPRHETRITVATVRCDHCWSDRIHALVAEAMEFRPEPHTFPAAQLRLLLPVVREPDLFYRHARKRE